MIKPLRNRHRNMIFALTIALPVLFIAAMLSRELPPAAEGVSALYQGLPSGFDQEILADESLWDDLNISTRVLANSADSVSLALTLTPKSSPKVADMLVYWHAGNSGNGEALPAGAYLLGTFAGNKTGIYQLPPAAAQTDGAVILYSLAHQQVIAAADLAISARLAGRNQ